MTKAPLEPLHVDQFVRTNRKTVALVVTRDGKLIVRAPLRMSAKTIEAFIEQHRAWILAKQAQAHAYTHQAIAHAFTAGESFLYQGHAYPLVLSPRMRPLLALEAHQPGIDKAPSNIATPLPGMAPSLAAKATTAPSTLVFVLSAAAQPAAREVFVRWYRAQALAVLRERVAHWSAQTGLLPSGLRITSARTRWGSCSSRGVLSFPWRLVMAPLPVIDYVVVHELVHLKEKNHARPFWQGVAGILPGYAIHTAWLKENGHLLSI